jgi:hypothetical protein
MKTGTALKYLPGFLSTVRSIWDIRGRDEFLAGPKTGNEEEQN